MLIKKDNLLVRVYYEDTDAGGIVFYARYLAFYERARTEMLRKAKVSQQNLLKQNIAFVVKNCQIDYLFPAKLDDLLTIETTISQIKRVSLHFEQKIFNQHNQQINCAKIVVACINLAKMKPETIPASIVAAFSSMENL